MSIQWKKGVSIVALCLSGSLSLPAQADSGNSVTFKYGKSINKVDFKYIEGSDVVGKKVTFKKFESKPKSSQTDVKVTVSKRQGETDIMVLEYVGSRFNYYVADTMYNPCNHKCNFLLNTEMSINGENVVGDVILGQGHNQVQSRNYWFVGMQVDDKNLMYGETVPHDYCKELVTESKNTYKVCAKGASKFEIHTGSCKKKC